MQGEGLCILSLLYFYGVTRIIKGSYDDDDGDEARMSQPAGRQVK